MTPKEGHEAFLAKILDHCSCEVCDKPLTRADVVSVRRSESMWLVNVVCSSCQARGLIFVLIKDSAAWQEEETSYAPVAHTAEGITAEDCRFLREYLRSFEGDCTDLFRTGD